jgi:SAM-dependent methyltransferase
MKALGFLQRLGWRSCALSTSGKLGRQSERAADARKAEPPEYRYVEGSYEHLESTVLDAREIVPEVLRLVRPASVIDLGCGIGTWLSVFRELGVTDAVGVDGHWVDRGRLEIPDEDFLVADLRRPIALQRTFDLAVSTETAEHLPPESAECFVDSLTCLAPVVLFCAAAPFVPGNLHINCQWPSYWARLFQERGFAVADPIRKRVWTNKRVRWFYSQTMLLFINEKHLQQYPLLAGELVDVTNACLDIIHPDYYLERIGRQ